MIKTSYHCDFCENVVSSKEYIDQTIKGESATKELDLHRYLICEACANKIDYTLLKFKMEVNHNAEN